MKKIMLAGICAAMLFSANVYAEDSLADNTLNREPVTAQIADEKTSDTENIQISEERLCELEVNVKILENGNIYPKNLVLGVYSPDKRFWGASHVWVAEENCEKTIKFSVPEYTRGEKLYINLYSGAEALMYGGKSYKADELIEIDTANEINVEAFPEKAVFVKAFANEWELYFKNPAKLIDGTTMISLDEYLTAMSMMHCKTEQDGKTEVKADGHSVVFYVGGNDMYADGRVTYTDTVPTMINGQLYVPIRFLIESLGGTVTAEQKDGVLNVTAEYHFSGLKPSEFKVKDIKSRTDSLIWISCKDFTVTVFENKYGTWSEKNVYPCSVGAVSTPTVKGEFEYFSKESRWSYPTYYVGPIMRFYRGYALHSTLLRYDGSNADGRIGKRISHGCVRMRPEDIQYLTDTIPLYTKVYVTE